MSNIPRHAIIGNEAHALVYVNPQELAALHATRKGKPPVLHKGVPAFIGGVEVVVTPAVRLKVEPPAQRVAVMGGATGSGTGADIGNYGIDSGSIGVNQDISGFPSEPYGMMGMTSPGQLGYGVDPSAVSSVETNPAVMPHLSQFPVDMMSYMDPYGTPGNPTISGWQKTASDWMAGNPKSTSAIGGVIGGVLGPHIGSTFGRSLASNAQDLAAFGEPQHMAETQAGAAANTASGKTTGGGDAFENTPFYGTETEADLSQYQGWGILSPDRIGQSAELAKEAAKEEGIKRGHGSPGTIQPDLLDQEQDQIGEQSWHTKRLYHRAPCSKFTTT